MSTEIGTTRISSNIECDNVIINSKGNLNDIIARTESTETKNTEQDTRLDALEQNTLKVSYIDTNAALKVTSADENNDPRYVLKFNINITFNDSNYYPIFTSEKKTIVAFSYSYIYSTSGKAYAHTCYVYAESSNGLTSNITIESCSIQKGSIDIVVSVKRTSDLHTFGITWGLAYYPHALISYPVSDEYIISKNVLKKEVIKYLEERGIRLWKLVNPEEWKWLERKKKGETLLKNEYPASALGYEDYIEGAKKVREWIESQEYDD